jgi:hypothetical protein
MGDVGIELAISFEEEWLVFLRELRGRQQLYPPNNTESLKEQNMKLRFDWYFKDSRDVNDGKQTWEWFKETN